jgi:hypothetical protein
MRAIHDDQSLQGAPSFGGEAPGDYSSPVMPDQRNVLGIRRIDQRPHIIDQVRQRVVCDIVGSGGAKQGLHAASRRHRPVPKPAALGGNLFVRF